MSAWQRRPTLLLQSWKITKQQLWYTNEKDLIFYHDDKETKNIKIKVKMDKYIDAKETEHLIKLYVEHSLQNIKPEQIHIDILQEN